LVISLRPLPLVRTLPWTSPDPRKHALTRELPLVEDPPTALFTSQNLITIDAVRAIHDMHMQRDVALVGVDDVALAHAGGRS
jgi:DNA-binding LacI/PurR family transcriptional regulator